MAINDATQRFSSRVEKYVRYRPGYPAGIVDLLKSECGMTATSAIADIAFGTGIFTRLLLENGNPVFGVEPNPEMRHAGEEYLSAYPRFRSVAGTAEATTLAEHSIDILTAAQAAHWFDFEKARREFVRILKPGGWAVLLWNDRRIEATAFAQDYEQLLLTYGADYHEVKRLDTNRTVEAFFAPSRCQTRRFEFVQKFDYAGLEGRLLSSSYTQAADPRHQPMLRELRRIFDLYQVDGQVAFEYDTPVYYGQLD